MRVMYLDWQLNKEVLVPETRLLETVEVSALDGVCILLPSIRTYASVVNLFSLEEKADMN